MDTIIKTKDWAAGRIKEDEIKKYMDNGRDFIDDSGIIEKLKLNKNAEPSRIMEILKKSLAVETLTPDETALLLNVDDKDMLDEMEKTAAEVKRKVYDNRIVTFAPLYLGNKCVNNCFYCGFRSENDSSSRRVLEFNEVKKEIEVLTGKIGHKRLVVVYGEHPSMDIDYMTGSIKAIYSVSVQTKKGHSEIRRVNVNAPPLSVSELRKLKEAGIGTYQVFQETYNRQTYANVHPVNTIKGNYRWRLYSMHRAMEAGVDDVGIGVLFGLHDWRFEVMGLLYHAIELEKKFGIGPHTISFPRLEPAENTPFTKNNQNSVSDEDFKKLITVIRLSVPYTGMIITARETRALRKESFRLGVTQTDASSRIGIGAYSEGNTCQEGKKQQFFLGDTRSLDEVIKELAEMGYITSFCTAGYRCGRTGLKIMDLLRTGTEGKFCKQNAVLTFREWLDDFASPQTLEIGEKLISKEIEEIKTRIPKFYGEFINYYDRVKSGERDIYV